MTYGHEDEYGEAYVRQWEREHPVLDFVYSLIALVAFFALYGLAYGIVLVPPLVLIYCILKSALGF